jgi:multimeric flavodoxin WrbA
MSVSDAGGLKEARRLSVIGIAGSPRKRGNSALLLEAALNGAAEAGAQTRQVYLNGLNFRGCQACMQCEEDGACKLKDGLSDVIASLAEAQIWILASPIYFDGVAGPLKTFFDRCHCYASGGGPGKGRLKGRRRGALIVTYADKSRQDYRKAAHALVSYFLWMGDFGKAEVLDAGELWEAGAVNERPELLRRATELGRRLVTDLIGD